MFDSKGGLHSLPQWVEVYNNTDAEINMRGWQLTLERTSQNPLRVENKQRKDVTIVKDTVTIKSDIIIPSGKTTLLVSGSGRQPRPIIEYYNLFNEHYTDFFNDVGAVENRNRFLQNEGFTLTVLCRLIKL